MADMIEINFIYIIIIKESYCGGKWKLPDKVAQNNLLSRQCPGQWRIILKVSEILSKLWFPHEDFSISSIFRAESKNKSLFVHVKS